MQFGLWAWMGPRNHVFDGVHISQEKWQFWGKGEPIVKYGDSAVSCAKTAAPIDLPFGLWTRVDRGKQVQSYSTGGANVPHGRTGHIGAIWRRIRLNRPSAAAIRPYVKLLLSTRY